MNTTFNMSQKLDAVQRSDPTFPYDAFGQDKLRKMEPPPDASKYMNRSISDNAGCFIVIGIIVLLVLWALVGRAFR